MLISHSLNGCSEISYVKCLRYGFFQGLAAYTAVLKLMLISRSLNGCNEIYRYLAALFKGLAGYAAVVKEMLTSRSLNGCCEISS